MSILQPIIKGTGGSPGTKIYFNNDVKKVIEYPERIDFLLEDIARAWSRVAFSDSVKLPYEYTGVQKYQMSRLPCSIGTAYNEYSNVHYNGFYYDDDDDILYAFPTAGGVLKFDGYNLYIRRGAILGNKAFVKNNGNLEIYNLYVIPYMSPSTPSLSKTTIKMSDMSTVGSTQTIAFPSGYVDYLNNSGSVFFGTYDNKLFWITAKSSSKRNMVYDMVSNTFTQTTASAPTTFTLDTDYVAMSYAIHGSNLYVPVRTSNTARRLYSFSLPNATYTTLSNPYLVTLNSNVRSAFGRYSDDAYIAFAYNLGSDGNDLKVHLLDPTNGSWTTLLNSGSYANSLYGTLDGITLYPIANYYDDLGIVVCYERSNYFYSTSIDSSGGSFYYRTKNISRA